MRAIGILGGTFDPVHLGHLRMAQEMAESLSLGSVHFIPAAVPPHRAPPSGPDDQRIAMVQLAIADNPLFQLDLREFYRSGPSYMVDTLMSLRAEVGARTPLYLLLGADAFLGLPTWHRWRELFGLAHVAVAHRPGFQLDAESPKISPLLREEWLQRHGGEPDDSASGRILSCEMTALDISASALRGMISGQRSIRYLVPAPVESFIQTHHLYEKEAHGS